MMIKLNQRQWQLSKTEQQIVVVLILKFGSLNSAVNKWYFESLDQPISSEEEDLLKLIHDAQVEAGLDI